MKFYVTRSGDRCLFGLEIWNFKQNVFSGNNPMGEHCFGIVLGLGFINFGFKWKRSGEAYERT